MCLVAMPSRIGFQSASGGMVLATVFTGHESLPLFPLGLPKKSCVQRQPALQELQAETEAVLKGSREATWSKNFVLNMCSRDDHVRTKLGHESEFSFICVLECYEYTVRRNCCVFF